MHYPVPVPLPTLCGNAPIMPRCAQRSFCIVLQAFVVLVVCCALPSTARCALPPPSPDGGYPNNNTAEGNGALFNVTTGDGNTAVGSLALTSETTGRSNT